MAAESKYSYELIADIHDMDFNGVAKTSAVLRYIQTAAQNQLTENGLSYDNLYSRGLAFIISRMKLEIYKPISVLISAHEDEALAIISPSRSSV